MLHKKAGGLFSTAYDYLLFSKMLLGKGDVNGVRLLSPKHRKDDKKYKGQFRSTA
jgi:CubicO group peptidase (beta-lactamase class C family)